MRYLEVMLTTNVFKVMEINAEALKINDWGITETTLEEAFWRN